MSNLNNFPTGAPSFCEGFWDFITDEELTEFTVTAVTSGTNSVLDTYDDGVMVLSGAATTDDSGSNLTGDAQWISLGLGKTIRYETLIQLNETTSTDVAVQSDFITGLTVADTSLIASAPTDGIYFRKDDGDALLDCIVRTGSADASTSIGVATLVSGTWYRLGIQIVMDATTAAKGTVTFYLNGTSVASLTVTGLPASTAILTPAVAFQSGNNTGTKFMLVDYIGVRMTR